MIKRNFLEDNKTARKLLVGKTAVGKKAIGGEVLAPSSTAEMSSKRFGGKGARGKLGGGGRRGAEGGEREVLFNSFCQKNVFEKHSNVMKMVVCTICALSE